ncbi:DegV family protein [Lactiplantibacillus modestisalitolerans]|uniref:DegV family protein n=1 Tax=Lactiplantibacillus modestisalitolerans TaxID=1457219 RepID=A0ABV5WUW9_9LACO|nr:DegV family protein [Lactiplantibacillus modestisalitolerans]
MKWTIITDSSCDLFETKHQSADIQFASVPFTLQIGKRVFRDDDQLNQSALLKLINAGTWGKTSCPTPEDWLTQFRKPGNIIAMTISSHLSGSMNSAMVAKRMMLEEEPDKKIAIIDSKSAGPELALGVEQMEIWIQRRLSFDDIVAKTEQFIREAHTLFMLKSFNHLIENGRLGKIKVLLAHTFKVLGIGYRNRDGEIKIKDKTRGAKRAIIRLIQLMKTDGFNGGKVCISHCENSKFVQLLKQSILKHWQNTEILVLPTRGLCSYYAEQGGVIVSYH